LRFPFVVSSVDRRSPSAPNPQQAAEKVGFADIAGRNLNAAQRVFSQLSEFEGGSSEK
jgi:hypothetical protein